MKVRYLVLLAALFVLLLFWDRPPAENCMRGLVPLPCETR